MLYFNVYAPIEISGKVWRLSIKFHRIDPNGIKIKNVIFSYFISFELRHIQATYQMMLAMLIIGSL